MSNNAELDNLYSQLESAEAVLARAIDEFFSCSINTPGRCAREADRVTAAERWVAGIKAQIRMLEYEAEEA